MTPYYVAPDFTPTVIPGGAGFTYLLFRKGTRTLMQILFSRNTPSDEMFKIADGHSNNHPDCEVHVFHGTPKHGRVVHKVK